MIGFAEPAWLAVTVLLLVLCAGVMAYGEIRRRELLAALANPRLVASLTANLSMFRRRLKQVLLMASLLCFGAALARPQAGYRWEQIKRKGIDILFAIDTSRSMLAQDVRPSRLERSKLAVIDFSRNFGGGRLGLVPFAGSAFLMCPLTLDTGAFYEALESLDTGVIGRPGTDIGSALREASQAFAKGSGDEKVLVLITDGEDLEGDALDAAREVAEQGVKIYAVGVGTASGELIPDFRKEGGVSFIRDDSGNLVKSRLDEKVLREISSLTGGSYYPLGPQGEGLEAILRDNRHLMKELEVKESMRKVPLEQFQWPLLAGLILLMAETLVRETKGGKRAAAWAGPRARVPAKAALLLLCGFFGLSQARASVRDAEKSMKSGRYADAAREYGEALKEEPEETALVYNKGVAAYRAKQFEEAAEAFEEAKRSRDLRIQKKAYYNLGNTRFRSGELTEQSDRAETVRRWEAALASYEGALALDKEDQDARFNRDLVRKRLEELKKNPPPQEQNKDRNGNQNQDQNQDRQQNQKQDPDNKEGRENKDKKESSGGNPGDPEKKEGSSGSEASDPARKEEGREKNDPGRPDEKAGENRVDPEKGKSQDPGKEQDAGGKAGPVQPGQMTREEAQALLNAARNGQKQLLLPITRSKDSNRNNPNQRNW